MKSYFIHFELEYYRKDFMLKSFDTKLKMQFKEVLMIEVPESTKQLKKFILSRLKDYWLLHESDQYHVLGIGEVFSITPL